jgi:hypothetical protein
MCFFLNGALHEYCPVIHNTVLLCTDVNEFIVTVSGFQQRCTKKYP